MFFETSKISTLSLRKRRKMLTYKNNQFSFSSTYYAFDHFVYMIQTQFKQSFLHADSSICLPDDNPADPWVPVENYPCYDPIIEDFVPEGKSFKVSVFNKAHSFSEAEQFCKDKGSIIIFVFSRANFFQEWFCSQLMEQMKPL